MPRRSLHAPSSADCRSWARLGSGNHYAEIQVVDEIFDKAAAKKMGIDHTGQVVVMVHSGSRGLGHQVASDCLVDHGARYGEVRD